MQVRRGGEVYFVLTRGILAALVLDVLGFLLIGVWYRHERFEGLREFLIANGVGSIIGGFFAGRNEWKAHEKRYRVEMTQFSLVSYESPEETLKQLQRGTENGR